MPVSGISSQALWDRCGLATYSPADHRSVKPEHERSSKPGFEKHPITHKLVSY
jgi:hypothetical protein